MDCSALPEEFAAPLEALPSEKNIAYKAALKFLEAADATVPGTVAVKITKRIPSGAGLGGGSTDAAAVLLALNQITGEPLGAEALGAVAAALGSDVPFFLGAPATATVATVATVAAASAVAAKSAYVTGRGERIESISAPSLHILLIKPHFASDTARAYALLDKYREYCGSGSKSNDKNELIAKLQGDPKYWFYTNDFLPAFLELGSGLEKSTYKTILSDLYKAGASYANISGSGSSCFGIFSTRAAAAAAQTALSKTWPFTKLCGSNSRFNRTNED
jgi:4-diphosphocytidyl-2-C-methyl-D-erythritol kinase